MPIIDNTKELTSYINSNKEYTKYNYELFDIYEGNLRKYIEAILESTLSDDYYSQIKHRIYPINILRRIIDKLARSYSSSPQREATSNQDIVEFYENSYMFNQKMNSADEFVNLFKGYALEPFIQNGIPSLRVLPYDRFLVQSDNIIDPTVMTRFYKYVGKIPKQKGHQQTYVDLWFVYTNEEFIAMDEDGDLVPQYMVDGAGNPLNGENPFGFIPFYYGNRSQYQILPVQDSDTLSLAKLLSVQISDLAGTIMFQCFSIIYGVDIESANMKMSPNGFWSLRSDPQSGHTPQVGTITPTANISDVLAFVREVFATWMESRGIRVGSLGKVDGQYNVSGVSKVIDEMDTFEAIIKQQKFFEKDEYNFWQLQKNMHNFWLESGELTKMARLPDNWEVFTEFDEPKPVLGRQEEIDSVIKEKDAGLISTEMAIKKLYPDREDQDIQLEIQKINDETFNPITEDQEDDSTESEDQA